MYRGVYHGIITYLLRCLMSVRTLLAATLIIVSFSHLSAQESQTIRICTYNLLQFGDDDTDRVDKFRLILNEIRPSILTIQEAFQNPGEPGGVDLFQDSVADLLDIPLVRYIGWDVNSHEQVAILIDTAELVYIGGGLQINNNRTPRKQLALPFVVKRTDDTIIVFTGHWKAGDEAVDAVIRKYDAVNIVDGADYLVKENATPYYVFAGDMNVYNSNEEAYQVMIRGNGVATNLFVDPIARPGDWHNNDEFAPVHTQSTRARQFGGGVNGGLDDRFDQILVSPALLPFVLSETYTAFGNDGQHFNDSINAHPNTSVSPEMAQALHDASDHLPVFVDVVFQKSVSVFDARVTPDQLDLTESVHHVEAPQTAAPVSPSDLRSPQQSEAEPTRGLVTQQ